MEEDEKANDAGDYAFTIFPGERCDLFVTNGKLSAYRLGFQPIAEPQQRLDWTLADPEKTPVELGSSRRRQEADDVPTSPVRLLTSAATFCRRQFSF